jgi:hypothetical protein
MSTKETWWVVKTPYGFHSSIRKNGLAAKLAYLQDYYGSTFMARKSLKELMVYWRTTYRMGYRCVKVEIREK